MVPMICIFLLLLEAVLALLHFQMHLKLLEPCLLCFPFSLLCASPALILHHPNFLLSKQTLALVFGQSGWNPKYLHQV